MLIIGRLSYFFDVTMNAELLTCSELTYGRVCGKLWIIEKASFMIEAGGGWTKYSVIQSGFALIQTKRNSA
jgi:hypothetical protein